MHLPEFLHHGENPIDEMPGTVSQTMSNFLFWTGSPLLTIGMCRKIANANHAQGALRGLLCALCGSGMQCSLRNDRTNRPML